MNVKRALQVLPEDVTLTAETRLNYYGSAWVVWAAFSARECPTHGDSHGLSWCDVDGCDQPTVEAQIKRPVTMLASTDAFGAANWLADFERCRHRP